MKPKVRKLVECASSFARIMRAISLYFSPCELRHTGLECRGLILLRRSGAKIDGGYRLPQASAI
jgi:hypothetical protein